MAAKELKSGEACPSCGGELKPARTLSADEYRKVYDRENPGVLPYNTDTASPEQRAELGDLYTCGSCGYKTRFPASGGHDAAGSGGHNHTTGTPAAGGRARSGPSPAA